MIDADPQGSARDWLAARESHPPFTIVGLDRPTIHPRSERLVTTARSAVVTRHEDGSSGRFSVH